MVVMKDKLTDYFNGALAPEQETAVQNWLSLHGHERDVEKVLDSLFEAALPNRDINIDSAYATISGKMHISGRKRKGTWRSIAISAAAAVVAVAICIPFAYKSGSEAKYQELSGIEWIETNVPHGQSRTVELSDGTVLELRPGTRIIYPSAFSGAERKIFLEGEVYAKVFKNPDQPFVISSRNTEVKVFGTTFNFKSYDFLDIVELMLFDGKVSFSVNTDKLSKTAGIRPGQVAHYDRSTGRFDVSDFNRSVYKDLCDNNSLFYYDLTLKDIAHDLEQRFGSRIIITNEDLAMSRIFAMFTNNESLDQILSAIGAGRRMTVKHTNNTIYLSSN